MMYHVFTNKFCCHIADSSISSYTCVHETIDNKRVYSRSTHGVSDSNKRKLLRQIIAAKRFGTAQVSR